MNDNSTARVKRWREAHREEYLKRQREYARKHRGIDPVDAVAGRPLMPSPVMSGGVGRIDVLPMTRARWAKMIQEQREKHLVQMGIASEEAKSEYLESLPAK